MEDAHINTLVNARLEPIAVFMFPYNSPSLGSQHGGPHGWTLG